MKKVFLILALVFVSFNVLAQKSPEEIIRSLNWVRAPAVGKVGDKAEIKLTGNLQFLGAADTNEFLKANGNLGQANAYTVMNADIKSGWFGVFQFVDSGYVKDDEKIDAAELLASLKANNVSANEERKKQGLPTLVLEDWYFPPRYDTESKRLEWGTRLRSEGSSEPTVNVTTKILGRGGYFSAILVSGPQSLERDLVEFKQALRNFDYVSGEKYREWREGDKVAAFGLGALVLGGAAAVATKKGGLKLIGLAVLAALAAGLAMVKKFFGKK